MMLVRCEVRPSPIHGLGLFVLDQVPEGGLVWRFDRRVDIVLGGLPSTPSVALPFFYKYAYLRQNGVWILCGDLAKFMNHSENPTLGEKSWMENENDYAARDLTPGDELTCDYRTFDYDWKYKLGVLAR